MYFSAERKAGYQKALENHGLPFRENYCVEIDKRSMDNEFPFSALLEQPQKPTAVVASDDILAVALEQVCAKKGFLYQKIYLLFHLIIHCLHALPLLSLLLLMSILIN